ncbi:hypothetical protein L207DRAFT_504579 [Hyaloscypha variabilis F]|uniref:Uncharacterized protein n=1 Tax=Hyaloscypha variabilis (strain UAMH 11265 / GT02V1 / F) TaxID=1149755 RepID=A0A2J6QSF0_HYAVF|nr:hypothetical protein L207DRAFT_504579 [Hyaloscypha variabilis F]
MDGLSQEPLLGHSQADIKGSEKEETAVSTAASGSLPDFNDSRATAILCLISLAFTWLAVIGCFVAAVLVIKVPGVPGVYFLQLAPLSTTAAEALSFAINIVVGLITDGIGFIHGTSLRWSLYHERRLHFNTNIRLFTSARRSAPNRWPSNLLCITSLILCYAATSQLFVKFGDPAGHFWVNRMAIAALGLGLLIQAAVATWCIFSTLKAIPTWSSNPLNNALTRLHLTDLAYVHGRCMMSVHQRSVPQLKTRPLKKQRSLFTVRYSIKYILMFVWSLVVLAIAWALAILLVSRRTMEAHTLRPWYLTASWYMVTTESGEIVNYVPLFMDPSENTRGAHFNPAVQVFCAILFTCAIQGAQTIGLHCVELLVNLSRQEPNAKEKLNKKGAQLEIPAFRAAATSWEYSLLFILKALLHWLLGQSLQATFALGSAYSFNIVYIRVFVYSIVAMVLAVFATYLAFQKPKGPQPATWGHLQTLADLVDDWRAGEDGSLWWGDKGSNEDNTRHAGTSANRHRLGEIHMDAEYEGI